MGFTVMCAALLLSFCREAGENIRDVVGIKGSASAFHGDMLRHTTLSSDLRSAVARRSSELEKLLQSPDIVAFIKSIPDAPEPSTEQIQALDARWTQAAPEDELVRKISDNACSKHLQTFRNEHLAFAEIFVTNTRGFNICQSNKTSDFYQADEGWWREGYSDGKGRRGYGSIEFDESARIESIPVHTPVYDPETRKVIGIAKGVLNLTRILAEL